MLRRLGSIVGDVILLFILAFALTSMYSKVKIVLDNSISQWAIHWSIMWRTTKDLFVEYPIIMMANITVIFAALGLIWRNRRAPDVADLGRRLDTMQTTLTNMDATLRDIRDALRRLGDGNRGN